jgi:hypothetical protein
VGLVEKRNVDPCEDNRATLSLTLPEFGASPFIHNQVIFRRCRRHRLPCVRLPVPHRSRGPGVSLSSTHFKAHQSNQTISFPSQVLGAATICCGDSGGSDGHGGQLQLLAPLAPTSPLALPHQLAPQLPESNSGKTPCPTPPQKSLPFQSLVTLWRQLLWTLRVVGF